MLYLTRTSNTSAFALRWSTNGSNFTLVGAVLITISRSNATADFRLAGGTAFPILTSGSEELLLEADAGLANVTTTSGLESWLSGQGISRPDAHQVTASRSVWDPNGSNPTFVLGPGPVEIGHRNGGRYSDIGRGVRSAVVGRNGNQERDCYYGIWGASWPIAVASGDAIRLKVATDVAGSTPAHLDTYLDNRAGTEDRHYVLETY